MALISPHFHSDPFPLYWVQVLTFTSVPTGVASAATKPFLESKWRDSDWSLVYLITNQSARPSFKFSIQDRCKCWPWYLWEARSDAFGSCDTDRRSLIILLNAKKKTEKKKESQIRDRCFCNQWHKRLWGAFPALFSCFARHPLINFVLSELQALFK